MENKNALKEAARSLVNSFSAINTSWLPHIAQDHEPCYALPMWGTSFIVQDPCDDRRIRALLEDIPLPEPNELGLEDDASEDKRYDEWGSGGYEDYEFHMAGWQRVADTGILAREFDGELVLGIHGAGYDFYASHWVPLYQELGYSWHE